MIKPLFGARVEGDLGERCFNTIVELGLKPLLQEGIQCFAETHDLALTLSAASVGICGHHATSS